MRSKGFEPLEALSHESLNLARLTTPAFPLKLIKNFPYKNFLNVTQSKNNSSLKNKLFSNKTMDEEKIPQKLQNIIFTIILIFIIQIFFFIYKIQIAKFLLIGILIFMVSFSVKNKYLKKSSENNFLKKDYSWFKSKYKLTKEIP